MTAAPVASEPMTIAAAHFAASNEASERFFTDQCDAVAAACGAMAARFQHGARLLVYGEGSQRSDVAHVVVEFVHPVVVGKRALPALALATPGALHAVGRDGDMLMLLCGGVPTDEAHALLAHARARGMLVLALTGALGNGSGTAADFVFAVPSHNALIVQETHEMLYHILWELVHVFFEHRATS